MKYHLSIIICAGLLLFAAGCSDKKGGDDTTEGTTDTTTVITPQVEPTPATPESKVQRPFVFERNKNRYPQNYFRNPFDSAIYVSGTFCELRSNHFHGGLDIRTGGVQGWEVKAAADGFIERIKVSRWGYGKALYIRHTNGYTTVYGHLKDFKGAIANYVKDAQYAQRSQEVELYPKRNELKVSKGQVIAWSGNTGGSGGPHLHFEIRDPQGQATNPLMYGLKVVDRMAPQIKHLAIYLKDKEQLYAQGDYPYAIHTPKAPYFTSSAPMVVRSGTYGLGLHVDDYFTDYANRLGINYCWVTVNDQLLYQYQIERFDFTKGRYINTHIDPYLKAEKGTTYIRLFKEPYNPLPYYKQRNNGEIWLKDGDTVRMKLFVQDHEGFIDSLVWTMVGKADAPALTIPAKGADKTFRVTQSQGRNISFGNWSFSFNAQSFYHPFDCKMKAMPQRSGMLNPSVEFHNSYTSLHDYVQVSYKLDENMIPYGDKLCAVSIDRGRKVYEGGEVRGDKLWFKTRSFGEYAITYDNTAPTIRVLKMGESFRFKLADDLSGVDQIICSLDDKWILYDYEPKTGILWGEIPKWIKPGEHQFKLVVIDSKLNRKEYTHQLNL